ncbi:MAG: LAGLIDADG family homing endonuclease, partial [Candidatus Micrarchaeales archaeon]
MQIAEIENMALLGRSLSEISKKLILSKSTVYYWYRKFWGLKQKKVNVNKKVLEDIGEVVGIFAGDGNYYLDDKYKYVIRVSLDSSYKGYVKKVAQLFYKVFNKRPWIYEYPPYNVTIVRIISKEVLNFFKEYLIWKRAKSLTIGLKNRKSHEKKFYSGFLRGLIDTDGSVWNKTATFSTISSNLKEDILFSLEKFHVRYKCYLQKDKRANRKPVY